MPQNPNFLLGFGERLTAPVQVGKGMGELSHPYSFDEARERLLEKVTTAAAEFSQLPPEACPDGYTVGLITLHPEYIAKSYFPSSLFSAVGMEAIGSRPCRVTPEKWRKKKEPEEVQATELFVAARRQDFQNWAKALPDWTPDDMGADQLFELEDFRAAVANDRLLPLHSKDRTPLLEVVLHISGIPHPEHILEAFEAYARKLHLKPDLDRRFEVGGLCFLPLRAPRELLPEISRFSFLRVAREMPSLRPLRPIPRAIARAKPFSCQLPTTAPVDPQLRAAVFDGGLPDDKSLKPFVNRHDPKGIRASVEEYVDHGVAVTSAVLFGPLSKGAPLSRPYGMVDHYRVLDDESEKDPHELYDVLARIRATLQSRKYSFVNLSVAPGLPIEDHEVHAWTAVLDELFADGETLATVAVGNSGEDDWASGNARVQVPSDSVNSLAIGAADSRGTPWRRASYSSIGPGRSPGIVKPDVIAFGGSDAEPFYVLDQSLKSAVPTNGTSFASPFALRLGMGVRAHFGGSLSPLAIRALLVHCSEEHDLPLTEVGWGRLPESLDDFVLCPDGTARIVYQGELTPAQYLRTPVPLPSAALSGKVTIRATFCFASETDPQDPSNYTRSGLDITFRPHSGKRDKDKLHAKTTSFFRRSDYDTEAELRHDAHKWETTLHRSRKFLAKSLHDPIFDVHYQTRLAGKATRASDRIRYALIITVQSPRTPDLYDRIMQRYRTILEPLRPIIEIPVRV